MNYSSEFSLIQPLRLLLSRADQQRDMIEIESASYLIPLDSLVCAQEGRTYLFREPVVSV